MLRVENHLKPHRSPAGSSACISNSTPLAGEGTQVVGNDAVEVLDLAVFIVLAWRAEGSAS